MDSYKCPGIVTQVGKPNTNYNPDDKNSEQFIPTDINLGTNELFGYLAMLELPHYLETGEHQVSARDQFQYIFDRMRPEFRGEKLAKYVDLTEEELASPFSELFEKALDFSISNSRDMKLTMKYLNKHLESCDPCQGHVSLIDAQIGDDFVQKFSGYPRADIVQDYLKRQRDLEMEIAEIQSIMRMETNPFGFM